MPYRDKWERVFRKPGLRHESYGLINSGYFWPIFVMAAWGVGVVINGYTAYRGNAITEEEIEREMKTLP